MRRPLFRPLSLLLCGLAMVSVVSWVSAGGDDLPRSTAHPEVEHDCRAGENPCALFLKYPGKPAWDACWTCGGCRAERALVDPKCCKNRTNRRWNQDCARKARFGCYCRRHAREWNLLCSEMEKQCCPGDHWKTCPEHKPGGGFDEQDVQWIVNRRSTECRVTGKQPDELIVIRSPHFYLVWGIRKSMKVRTLGLRAPRKFSSHELAHLYIQRCEDAYADFERAFGSNLPLGSTGRIGVFLLDNLMSKAKAAQQYLGNANTNLLYGGGSNPRGGDAFALCFVADPNQSDQNLHLFVRHEIGHILIAAYHGYKSDRTLPRWLYVGAAHWLAKLQPPLADRVTFCANEGIPVSGSGKNWGRRVASLVKSGKHMPLAELFLVNVQSQMTYEAHIEAWSLIEWLTHEGTEEFVYAVQGIKGNEQSTREALREQMGVTPEKLEELWAEFYAGGMREITHAWEEGLPEDATESEAATRKLVDNMLNEENPAVVSSIVDGLQKIEQLPVARAVVQLLARDSDLVRETAVRILVQSDDPDVEEFLRTDALSRGPVKSRAHVARVLGFKEDVDAVAALIEALEDSSFWLIRANAAMALSLIKDEDSLGPLTRLVKDSESKVKIAAMEALKAFGTAAGPALDNVCSNLNATFWQVRLTAVQALRAFRREEAIPELINRMKIEGGRVEDELYETLKDFSGRDLGMDAYEWQKWWERVKGDFIPVEPGEEEEEPVVRAGETGVIEPPPTYYGIELYSRGVVFVIDVSSSMRNSLVVNKSSFVYGEKSYSATTKIGVAREELRDTVRDLDPRTNFNIIMFNHEVLKWKSKPAKASDSNKDSAIMRVKNALVIGETNYHDTFQEVFGVEGEDPYANTLTNEYDTCLFLTDGRPTAGEVTRSEELLAWFCDQNRFAKMKVHVIALGLSDIDLEFLRGLAERNEGEFRHISDKQ